MDMLHIFFYDVYVLLDPNYTLYFMTPYVAFETFSISTHVGESVIARRIYSKYVVSIFL